MLQGAGRGLLQCMRCCRIATWSHAGSSGMPGLSIVRSRQGHTWLTGLQGATKGWQAQPRCTETSTVQDCRQAHRHRPGPAMLMTRHVTLKHPEHRQGTQLTEQQVTPAATGKVLQGMHRQH